MRQRALTSGVGTRKKKIAFDVSRRKTGWLNTTRKNQQKSAKGILYRLLDSDYATPEE
jgi:Ribonuclease G/E